MWKNQPGCAAFEGLDIALCKGTSRGTEFKRSRRTPSKSGSVPHPSLCGNLQIYSSLLPLLRAPSTSLTHKRDLKVPNLSFHILGNMNQEGTQPLY